MTTIWLNTPEELQFVKYIINHDRVNAKRQVFNFDFMYKKQNQLTLSKIADGSDNTEHSRP